MHGLASPVETFHRDGATERHHSPEHATQHTVVKPSVVGHGGASFCLIVTFRQLDSPPGVDPEGDTVPRVAPAVAFAVDILGVIGV